MKITCAIVFTVMLWHQYGFSQAGLTKELYDDIEAKASALYGQTYQVEFAVNIDSSHHYASNYLDGGIEDPYGTLHGCIVFFATGLDSSEHHWPRGFIGVYKNGGIVWHSDTLVHWPFTWFDLYGTKDLNNDGKVDLIAAATDDMRNEGGELWIFSWDGQTGTLLSDTAGRHHESVLKGWMSKWVFVDDNGDGVLEIHGISDENDSTVIYSWNGLKYGLWNLAFVPGRTPPRDRLIVDVQANARKGDSLYSYNYSVYNHETSLQAIDEFLLDRRTNSLQNPRGAEHWTFLDRLTFLTGWRDYFVFPNYISQGARDTGFNLSSTGLPGIITYYARGNNPPGRAPLRDTLRGYDEWKENAKVGYTVGPIDRTTPLDEMNFLDTLSSYTTQSHSLGWITTQSVADKYTALFDSAHAQLTRSAIRSTHTTLDTVLANAQRDSGTVLSSEAYALIYFNTQYLLGQLPTLPSQFELNLNIQGSGTVGKSPDLTLYDSATVVTLTAIPSSGYAFAGWSDSLTGTTNPASLVMNSNKVVTATFRLNTFTIAASAGANGSIAPSGEVSVTYGSSQTFTISPGTGYHTDSLLVDGVKVDSTSSYTFANVTVSNTIQAVFAIDQFTITPSAGSNGTISPSTAVTVSYGGSQTFTFTPSTGYHVDSLIVDGVSQTVASSYQFNAVTANHTIHVAFAIDQFTITSSADANGSIAPSGSVGVNYGSSQNFTFTPLTGYHIDSLMVDGVSQTVASSYQFTTVTANHTIRIAFAIDRFTITPSAGSNGTISPSTPVVVNYGGSQTFTFTPSTGYHIDSLIVDGVSQTVASSYQFTAVTANHTIRVAFAIDQFTITPSAGSNGTISPSTPVTVNYGGSQSFTVTPNSCYHVDSVLVDGVNQGQVTSYTFSNVTATHTIRSVFAISQYTITASAGTNGTISPSGTVSVNCGSSQTFTITPLTNYHVDSVLVDGVNQGQITSYPFTNVIATHTIRAVFAINTFTLTVTAVNGNVAKSPDQTIYNYGTSVQLTATAATGYHFTSWSGDTTSSVNPLTITMTSNKALAATFAINTYTITATAGSNGTISPSGSVVVNYGGSQTFTITANTGYHIDSVLVDGVNQGAITSYTFTSVAATHTIRGVFTGYTLTIQITGTGAVSKSPDQTIYTSGTSVQLTAIGGTGGGGGTQSQQAVKSSATKIWEFDHWAGDVTGTTNPTTITMTSNKTVIAVFKVTLVSPSPPN